MFCKQAHKVMDRASLMAALDRALFMGALDPASFMGDLDVALFVGALDVASFVGALDIASFVGALDVASFVGALDVALFVGASCNSAVAQQRSVEDGQGHLCPTTYPSSTQPVMTVCPPIFLFSCVGQEPYDAETHNFYDFCLDVHH